MSSHDNRDIEIKLECPYCPRHKESKLFLNTDLGIFHCYRCDFKGTVRSLKYTHPELFDQVKDLVSLASFGKLKAFNKVESNDTEIEADLSSSSFITNDDAQYQYLLNRGWTEENIFAYTPLKADSLKFYNRVIIPVVNNENNLIYYTARDISGKSKRKYLNPESDKNFIFTSKTSLNTVYSEDAFICEGIFDAFKTPNACALMGKTLNKKQHKVLYDFLKPKKNLYICLDPGTLKECKRLAEELDIWFPTKQIYIMNWVSTDEDIDLGDLSKTLSSKELVKYIKENSNLAA